MIVFFLFDDQAKRIAPPGISVEIQVIAEYLPHPHRHFGGLARVLNGVEKRIFQPPADNRHFRVRRNFPYFRRESPRLRHDMQHPIRINLVVDLPQCAFHRAAHGNRIPRPQLPQIVSTLRSGGRIVYLRRRQSELLQRAREVFSPGHVLRTRQHHFGADAVAFRLRQFHLALKLAFCRPPLRNGAAIHNRARRQQYTHNNPQTSVHSSPRSTKKLSAP